MPIDQNGTIRSEYSKLVNDCIAMLSDKTNIEFHTSYNLIDEKCITLGKN
jgi:hypothetical protein